MYEDLLRGALKAMLAFYAGEPELIQHFVKVHAFAAMIADKEITDERERFTLERGVEEAVIPYCLTHNIGLVPFSPIATETPPAPKSLQRFIMRQAS